MLGFGLGSNNNHLARKLSEFIASRLPEENSEVLSSESVSLTNTSNYITFHFLSYHEKIGMMNCIYSFKLNSFYFIDRMVIVSMIFLFLLPYSRQLLQRIHIGTKKIQRRRWRKRM
jgi:hypothetical protein